MAFRKKNLVDLKTSIIRHVLNIQSETLNATVDLAVLRLQHLVDHVLIIYYKNFSHFITKVCKVLISNKLFLLTFAKHNFLTIKHPISAKY